MNVHGPPNSFYDDYLDGDIRSVFSPDESEAWAAGPVFGAPSREHNMYGYMDDIENSSPSPPERRQSGLQSRYSNSSRLPMDQSDEITQFEDDADRYNQEHSHLHYAPSHDPYHSSPNPPGFRFPNSRYRPFQSRQPAFPNSFSSHNQINSTENDFSESSFVAPAPRMIENAYDAYDQDMPAGPHNGAYHGPKVPSSSSTPQISVIRESNPQNSRGIRLRPVSDLPDVYRGIFKFGVFNAIQSSCFDTIMESDKNMIISAPTGSGKTVIFELSIIRMLLNSAGNAQGSKCVYMAPTKALCSERYRDWASKFDGLGIKCCELTGDTVQLGKGAWGDAKDASIIITTGEKWDSLTRNWRDHDRILSQIQLFLVDEVHILNETRGSTLEVVISRMKARGTAVRFVTVSATVPNIDDVASWIGDSTSDEPALIFKFGEEFRPCQLKRFVYGFPKGKGQNDFTYAKSLSYRLFSILQQHIAHKPILVFCPTRNGVLAAAEQLAADFAKASESKQPLPWRAPTHVQQHFHDKRLEKLAQVGIGAHHAGLTIDDKRSVEDLYLNKTLPVVVATSTLAVGVNLPAHTVVINGVKLFQNGTSQEYSDLDIMQMMGRAGRPQFDKEGVAIIMCESELENKYKQLSEGRTLLESSLHRNLPEHLNSEVGLGTITDMESAKEWLHNSFLFRRIQKNPAHYAIGKQNDQTWQQRVDDMVLQSIEGLRSAGLLAEAEEGSEALSSTEYGDIMSKFYIRQSTMTLVINLPEKASLRDMLEMISNAEELSDLKLRAGERSVYNKIRDHEDIRFRIKKVEKASDKLFLLLQAVLGGISLNSPEFKAGDSQPHLEVFSVFRHVGRIARAVVEVALVKSNGLLIKNAQELVRVLSAKAWEDRPTIFRQIEYIGEKSIKVLAENGITTFEQLRQQPPYRIETLLNRKQVGFGHNVLAAVADLPQYFIKVTKDSVQTSDGQGPVEIELTIECGLKTQGAGTVTKSKKHKPYSLDYTSILTLTSDMELVDFRRIPTKLLKSNSKSFSVTAQLTKPSQSVYVHISSESIAGVTVTQQFKPKIDSKQFPVPDTRPKNAIDADLEGLEDVPEFWDVNISDEEIPIKDLTKTQPKMLKEPPQKGTPGMSKAKGGGDKDEPVAEPKMLPNGKYACNHNCKDKTNCRHFCCRGGLDKPAPAPKQRNNQNQNQSTSDKSKSAASHSSDSVWKKVHQPKAKAKEKEKVEPAERKAKAAANRQDKSMQQLEALHASTNVAANLKIGKDRRLKLPEDLSGPSEGARKGPAKRIAPKFDLEFCDLEDKQVKKSSALEDFEKHDSDSDDMPELAEVLHASTSKDKEKGKGKSGRKSGSDTSYSFADSEVDQLILHAAEDPTIDLTLEDDHAMDYTPSEIPQARARSPVLQDRKRKLLDSTVAEDDDGPSRKRALGSLPRSTTRQPLFLDGSSDPASMTVTTENTSATGQDDSKPSWGLAMDDEFVLDESLFTIVDDAENPPKTSIIQSSSSTAVDPIQRHRTPPPSNPKPEVSHSEFFWDAPPAWTTPPVWTAPASRSAPPAPRAPDAPAPRVSQAATMKSYVRDPSPVKEAPAPRELDALEEFEAWLASGSVIIVDDPVT